MTDLTREQASPARRASSVKRVGYASLAVVFAAFIVTEVVVSPNREINRSHVWAPLLFMVLPDVSLLAAFGSGLKPKQINPRGVLAYNLMHRLWGPMAMIALGFVFPFSPLFLASDGARTSRWIALWVMDFAIDPASKFPSSAWYLSLFEGFPSNGFGFSARLDLQEPTLVARIGLKA